MSFVDYIRTWFRSPPETRTETRAADAVPPEAQYRRATDVAKVGVWDWDIANNQLMFSPTLERMLGLASDAHIETFEDWEARVDIDGAAAQEEIAQAFLAGRHSGEYVSYYHVDLPEGRRYLESRAGPWLDADGRVLGLTGVDTDITELRGMTERLEAALDEARSANQAKSRFLANMSHEFRTPLNCIIGFAQVLQHEQFARQDRNKFDEYIGDIRSSGEHLLSLVNDLLDLSRIEAGYMEKDLEEVDAGEEVRSVARLFAQTAASADLNVNIDWPPGLPRLGIDRRHLHQIVLNLLSNALKFTPAGGRVEITGRAGAGDGVELIMQDTGIGIAAADIPGLVEPFRQAADSLIRAHPGTGLGLAITKALVEVHGGTLSIESEVGRGTTVTVALRRVSAADPMQAAS